MTDVFTELGSLLFMTSRHCSVLGAPAVSGHEHFGIRHFGTYSIRYIVTSGHAQFGTKSLGDLSYPDRITVLFQVTMYMQFAWKVGASANSVLIRYYSPCLTV